MLKLAGLHGKTGFILGVIGGCILCSCAGLTFAYKYYDPEFVSYDGKLLGPTEADDLSGQACSPSSSNPHPCVIMKADEFFRLKSDYLDMQNKLNSCEAGQ